MKNVEQTAEFWIEHLKLQEHPEGGYFREVYRSEELIPRSALPERYNGARNFGTSIYYLLKGNQFSIFHKLHSDEIWHFYEGSAAIIYLLRPGCELETLYLGRDIAGGEQLQVLIPR
jgi:predicted cupin superfamily sugar epimerase